MKQVVTKGATSQSVFVFVRDSSSTVGAGLTGLAYNTANLVASYARPGAARTAITLATQTVTGAWASGGFVEVDATNMPGVYRLDVPDAVFATGVNSAVVHLKGATNMEPCVMEFQLLAANLQDSVRAGLTALPNAAAEAAGGLFTRGTGAGQVNQAANGQLDANLVTWRGTQPNALTAGRVEVLLGAVTAGAISAAAFAANALDAVWSATTRLLTGGTNIVLAKGTGITGLNDLSAAQVNAECDTALADVGVTATVTGRIDAAVSTRLAGAAYTAPDNAGLAVLATRIGVPSGASIAADIADKTGYRLSTQGVNDLLRTPLTEGYAADGAAFTVEQALYMLWALLAERSITGTTLTAKKLDGTTVAMSFTLDSANPVTSQTRSA